MTKDTEVKDFDPERDIFSEIIETNLKRYKDTRLKTIPYEEQNRALTTLRSKHLKTLANYVTFTTVKEIYLPQMIHSRYVHEENISVRLPSAPPQSMLENSVSRKLTETEVIPEVGDKSNSPQSPPYEEPPPPYRSLHFISEHIIV